MKYFKLTKVDPITKISANVKYSKYPIFPKVEGMEIIIQDGDYSEFWYATAPDNTESNPINQFWQINLVDFKKALERKIEVEKEKLLKELYLNEKKTRDELLGRYHQTALIAGFYKIPQAENIINGGELEDSPEIVIEAEARDITPLEMAIKIIERSNEYKYVEAMLAGIRGKLEDLIVEFQFDDHNPIESWNEFDNEQVIVGTYTDENNEEQNIYLKKYSSDIRGYFNAE
jgi:hypothetical protein